MQKDLQRRDPHRRRSHADKNLKNVSINNKPGDQASLSRADSPVMNGDESFDNPSVLRYLDDKEIKC